MRIKVLDILLGLILTLIIAPICLAGTTDLEAANTDSIPFDSTVTEADTLAAGATQNSEESLYPMSPERKEKLISYSQFKGIWRFFSIFLGLAIMLLILLTGFSSKLRDWAQVAQKKFFIVWLYFILFMIADYLLNLPFSIYRGFIVESNYGFMNQTFMEWFKDDLLIFALGLLFGIIPVWFLYSAINKMKRWWLAFSLGAIPFVILLIVIVPIFVAPLFNDFTELKDKQLEVELRELATKVGIGDADIFEVNGSKQSTKINAYVTGLFGTKRIVLIDNLIDNFTYDEIKFVMGHEMGHYVMHHIWQGLTLAILFIAFALWLTSITIGSVINKFKSRFKFSNLGDIASLPLIMIFLSVLSFLFNPVKNGFSRYNEHQSDIYGMEMTEVSGESAAIAFDKLSVYNLSDPDPHPLIEFWFYSHPSLKKRMEFVRAYRP